MPGSGGGGRKPRKLHTPKFPELPPKYSSSRELRNKAEKLRRDRLNALLSRVKTLVPVICDKRKKSDTTRANVLRVSANYIRLNNLFPSKAVAESPVSLTNLHNDALNGCMFLVSERARILYIAESIEKHIGFTQLDMLGISVMRFIHPGDRMKFLNNLSRPPDASSVTLSSTSAAAAASPSLSSPGTFLSSPPGPSTSRQTASPPGPSTSRQTASPPGPATSRLTASPPTSSTRLTERRSFYVRVKEKSNSKASGPVKYEHMHIIGHLRRAGEMERRFTKDTEYVFVGVMKPVKDRSICELDALNTAKDEYVTRHLPDGRIIFTDQRIATVMGYLPSDVQGQSAFNYIMGDDLPWTTLSLRIMFASSKGEGTATYRLRSKTGQYVCLQSRGILEFNKTSKKIDHFVCINTKISEEEAERVIEEQKKRLTPYIANLHFNSLKELTDLNDVDNMLSVPAFTKRRKRGLDQLTDASGQPIKLEGGEFAGLPDLILPASARQARVQYGKASSTVVSGSASSPPYTTQEKDGLVQLAGDRGQVKRKYDENLNAWTNQSSPKFAKMEAPDEPFNSIRSPKVEPEPHQSMEQNDSLLNEILALRNSYLKSEEQSPESGFAVPSPDRAGGGGSSERSPNLSSFQLGSMQEDTAMMVGAQNPSGCLQATPPQWKSEPAVSPVIQPNRSGNQLRVIQARNQNSLDRHHSNSFVKQSIAGVQPSRSVVNDLNTTQCNGQLDESHPSSQFSSLERPNNLQEWQQPTLSVEAELFNQIADCNMKSHDLDILQEQLLGGTGEPQLNGLRQDKSHHQQYEPMNTYQSMQFDVESSGRQLGSAINQNEFSVSPSRHELEGLGQRSLDNLQIDGYGSPPTAGNRPGDGIRDIHTLELMACNPDQQFPELHGSSILQIRNDVGCRKTSPQPNHNHFSQHQISEQIAVSIAQAGPVSGLTSVITGGRTSKPILELSPEPY